MKVVRFVQLSVLLLLVFVQASFAGWAGYLAHNGGHYAGKVGAIIIGYPAAIIGGGIGVVMDVGCFCGRTVWKGASTSVIYLNACVFPEEPSKLRKYMKQLMTIATAPRTLVVIKGVVVASIIVGGVTGGVKVWKWHKRRVALAHAHDVAVAAAAAHAAAEEDDLVLDPAPAPAPAAVAAPE